MKLHSYWRSSCAYRVRIALGLKQLRFEYVALHLARDGGQQHTAEFAGLNPLRQVPVLEIVEEGQRALLVQSMAIIEYLEEQYPQPALLPRGAADRAHVRALAETVNSGIQPLQNTDTFSELRRHGVDPEPWGRHFIAKGLAALEGMAAARAGAFLFGDQVSLADVYLVPQLYNARRWQVPLAAFPTLLRADESARALPAFRDAAPEAQPDAETP
jgi:maleylpyruvate isomerase